MAFATSNVKSASIGGGFKLTTGDWTGAQADAPGTIDLAAGKVYQAQFLSNVTSGEYNTPVNVSPSGTAGIVTLTVYNGATVSAGTFSIISA